MNSLTDIIIQLPIDHSFSDELLSLLAAAGTQIDSLFRVSPTNIGYMPVLSLNFTDVNQPTLVFKGQEIDRAENIINQTGEERKNPHDYKHLPVSDVKRRFGQTIRIKTIDHLGFNSHG